jgi:acetoin utilization protein AcuB
MKISYKGFLRERVQRKVITIRPEASFYEANTLIREKGIRHLPVVDADQKLVGLVTDRDLRAAGPSQASDLSIHELHYVLQKMKVSAFMMPREKLITVSPDVVIEEAVQLMHHHKVGCLPIVEGDQLYGIITETDILAHFVDIFGLRQKGTRLTVALEDKPGSMIGILQVFKDHNINIISIVAPSFVADGKRLLVLRIEGEMHEDIVRELEKIGYEVLSIGKWPSR